MGSQVLIGVTVVFVLLVAGCGLWMNAASQKVDETIDHAVRLICYDEGFSDGANGRPKFPSYSDERCVEVYGDAYDDGVDGNYDPPEAE
jgi:hypothetical protein